MAWLVSQMKHFSLFVLPATNLASLCVAIRPFTLSARVGRSDGCRREVGGGDEGGVLQLLPESLNTAR